MKSNESHAVQGKMERAALPTLASTGYVRVAVEPHGARAVVAGPTGEDGPIGTLTILTDAGVILGHRLPVRWAPDALDGEV